MKLGILVNSNNHLDGIVGLCKSALSKNHLVTLFIMDTGTRLLEEAPLTSLAGLERMSISYCDHSAQELGVNTEGLSDTIERSSQYNNAAMNHAMDKIIVL